MPVPFDGDTLPSEWCTTRRLDLSSKLISPCYQLLQQSKCLEKVCLLWIKNELASSWVSPKNFNPILTESISNDDGSVSDDIDIVLYKCRCWTEYHWFSKLESLFLGYKEELDLLSCNLLRTTDRFLAYELYHRLKAKEASFAELSFQFGREPEKSLRGEYPLQSISSYPKSLIKPLKRLQPGEIMKPIKWGEDFAILQVNKWQISSFDNVCKSKLLSLHFDAWTSEVQSVIISNIIKNSF